MGECSVLYTKDVPQIKVMPEAMYKMRYYIDKTDKEIGWLGYVNKISDTLYVIEDVVLLKQRVHAATTEIDPAAIAELVTELCKTEEGREKYSKLKMWGHSHVNMSTCASGQDNAQMDDFANDTYFIRLIGNKKGEWNVCLYDYANNILWSELGLSYYLEVSVSDEELEADIKDKVSEIQWQSKAYPLASTWNNGKLPSSYRNYYEAYEKEEEKKKAKEKILEAYTITGEPTTDDLRNIKRFISSDEGELYYAVTGSLRELEDTIYDYYKVHLSNAVLDKLQKELINIWANKYEGGMYDGYSLYEGQLYGDE